MLLCQLNFSSFSVITTAVACLTEYVHRNIYVLCASSGIYVLKTHFVAL